MRGRRLRIVSLLFVVMLALWLPVVAASAQQDGPDYVGARPPQTNVSGVSTPNTHSGELPRTGAAIGTFVVLGVSLVVVGRVMRGRRAGKGTSS